MLAASLLSTASRLSKSQDKFLEDLSHRAFLYFWEQSDPGTGLVRDRASANGGRESSDFANVASIAATGFGLTALCIGAERGWIQRAQARERIVTTLRFFMQSANQTHGWFYHFLDATTGERRFQSEFSSIDTSFLLAGMLIARQYFPEDDVITELAMRVYQRVDFGWMLNSGRYLLFHGYLPETGFLTARWDQYCEHCLLYLLAIGTPSDPIPPGAWQAWKRVFYTYSGMTYVTGGPLFIHQYSHAWVDFRGRREARGQRINYFDNSITATVAHRKFCMDLRRKFPGYSPLVWGITASDSAKGYVAWGGPPADAAIDGSVVPCAAGGSLMFTPELSIAALMHMRDAFGDRVWKRYGFVDAFHPKNGWTDTEVVGIDLGITLLSAENLRSGSVWRWFMANEEITTALALAGLELEPSALLQPQKRAPRKGPG